MIHPDGIRSLYAHTAALYEQNVIPAFGPLAYDLATWITACTAEHLAGRLFDPFDMDIVSRRLPTIHALDLGTGTGILARSLAPCLGRVTGIDLSAPMIDIARCLAPHNVDLVVADVHHLPIHPGSIHIVVSSFGLNASTPKQSLRVIANLLRSGGVLAFQEWGALDPMSRVIDDALSDYVPDEIPELDDALRDFYAVPKPWDNHLQDRADYYEMLKNVGFSLVWVEEAPFVTVHFEAMHVFTHYKLAWPMRRLTLQAMTQMQRADFYTDLEQRLSIFLNADGSLDWTPPLFRVFAIR